MSLTQNQWYLKLKSFLPEWYFRTENIQSAHAQSLAKLLEAVHGDLEDHITETFITTATGNYLDSHGEERSIPRFLGETDAFYRERIRSITSQSNKPSLQGIVDNLLVVPPCVILEDMIDGGIFFDRRHFMSLGECFTDDLSQNCFTIILKNQDSDPNYETIYETACEIVNANKALGTLYRLIVRL